MNKADPLQVVYIFYLPVRLATLAYGKSLSHIHEKNSTDLYDKIFRLP